MNKIIKELEQRAEAEEKELVETYQYFYKEEMNYNEKEDGSLSIYVSTLDTNDEGAANYQAGFINGLKEAIELIKEIKL